MTPQIVDGLHYKGAPFYREVFKAKRAALNFLVERFAHSEVTSHFIEPMADGWAVTINLDAQEC